jgi:hypothetical protein
MKGNGFARTKTCPRHGVLPVAPNGMCPECHRESARARRRRNHNLSHTPVAEAGVSCRPEGVVCVCGASLAGVPAREWFCSPECRQGAQRPLLRALEVVGR